MSAAEVIELIKALSQAEQRLVVEFIQGLPVADSSPSGGDIRYADDEAARIVGDRVVERYQKTFRRLAE